MTIGQMPADQRLRVLLVDDSAAFRRSAARCLQGQPGCEVVGQASSGDEGLRLAEELRPDLALVDIAMPGIDGLEVARRLKIRTPAPHVVMLTIHDNPGYRAAALEAGADGFICKAEFTLHALSLLRDLAERARLEPPGRKVDPL